MLSDGAQKLEHQGSNVEVERSNARLRVLAHVSRAFAAVATDFHQLVEQIARTTADLVGDGCIVTLIDTDGETLLNAANAHQDRTLEVDYRAYFAGVGVSKITSESVSALVARTGEAAFATETSPAAIVSRSDDALKPVVARLNVHSYAVVPIRARETVIGTLSLVRSRPGLGYTPDDLTMLQDLADRAGLAIENARLYTDLERRVRERTAELETVNKELESFSYSVAHDLRAPLRSIDGFSRILLEECAGQLPATGIGYLRRVRGAAQRMGTLIDDLLALSTVARMPLDLAQVDLSQLVGIIVSRLREAEPQREVEVVLEPELIAKADRRLVEIALTNLISNAWKFTSKAAAARIELGAESAGSSAVFWIRDNGVGFDPAQAAKLFGVFTRLHPSEEYAGTGIGLATVQRIIQRHGGRVWASGELNRGATFSFTLAPGPDG